MPNTFLDGLYQFNVWGDGADYRLQVMGDAEAIVSSASVSIKSQNPLTALVYSSHLVA